jgi:Protein of unknown function (DUF3551)
MRLSTFLIGILFAAIALSTGAQAQNYPWCANYDAGMEGGGTNCGFTTFEQCMTTISGMGGSCDKNTQYVPPPGPYSATPVQHRRQPRKHHPQS